MGVNTTNREAARNMVLAGIGLGMMMQIFVLSVQNSVPRRAMGSATALAQFSRSIGATLGVALMGVIVNQNLPPGASIDGAVIHRLPLGGREALANAITPGLSRGCGPLRGRLRGLAPVGARGSAEEGACRGRPVGR